MPKRWLLISLYIIFAYLLGVAVMQYAKRHPIVDERPERKTEQPVSAAEPLPTDKEFWQAVRIQWGAYATPENVTFLHADVTCDGTPDYVGSRVNLDNPDGPFFDLLVLTHYQGAPRTELMSLPFTGSYEQYGLCGNPETTLPPEVSIESWTEAEIAETLGMKACGQAIAVVDGMCDSPRFFWAMDEETGEPAFVFFRH